MLVRVRREARPEPEELTPIRPPARAPARAQPPRTQQPRAQATRGQPRGGSSSNVGPDGNYTWFTINVGRSKNADPKWLIPLLCRKGNITKRAIGKIQIHARDTRVEIANDAVEQFSAALRRPDEKDPNIHIEPSDAPL